MEKYCCGFCVPRTSFDVVGYKHQYLRVPDFRHRVKMKTVCMKKGNSGVDTRYGGMLAENISSMRSRQSSPIFVLVKGGS
jgi:hypothetical protein